MTTCSTHVLDAALGRPAAGLRVHLGGPAGEVLATGATDADGRLRFEVDLQPGAHTLSFETGDWFAAAGRATLYPLVGLTFQAEAEEHYHLALLLSPYSYTTYRGS
ncbi:hydroxyisourate hydrolase [Nocardioides sp. cx-173]|uniref:hydroxyisourate hydrolase n=1 Tax=Nocardioides sp. cx-173 TaxID=2898796 RepID=UPI001E6437A5|nr:hydroxyisourate hydrolase [Nocardioides sp. cx-173]MCD4525598.1 hydroxyisourate hydrolase [Nocardioides sp. cx-173]UGB42742.1 hydroxyisourate hydrolase [Nocardioides sp. cx-173]